MSYAEKMEAGQAELRRKAHAYHEDFRRWPEDKKARHRKRRALHELLDYHGYPAYRIGVKEGRLTVGPKEAITPEAREFIANNRDDIMTWCEEWSKECESREGDGAL
jgi:hypothetical protein